jgi:hypothetical protein
MPDFTKKELFALAKGDYNTYLISKMSTFLNSSKRWYAQYKEKGGKKILKELEIK